MLLGHFIQFFTWVKTLFFLFFPFLHFFFPLVPDLCSKTSAFSSGSSSDSSSEEDDPEEGKYTSFLLFFDLYTEWLHLQIGSLKDIRSQHCTMLICFTGCGGSPLTIPFLRAILINSLVGFLSMSSLLSPACHNRAHSCLPDCLLQYFLMYYHYWE